MYQVYTWYQVYVYGWVGILDAHFQKNKNNNNRVGQKIRKKGRKKVHPYLFTPFIVTENIPYIRI